MGRSTSGHPRGARALEPTAVAATIGLSDTPGALREGGHGLFLGRERPELVPDTIIQALATHWAQECITAESGLLGQSAESTVALEPLTGLVRRALRSARTRSQTVRQGMGTTLARRVAAIPGVGVSVITRRSLGHTPAANAEAGATELTGAFPGGTASRTVVTDLICGLAH